jgi:hypothetical protein
VWRTQGELERAAKRVFAGCSRMVGASRTDAGAHAFGQVAGWVRIVAGRQSTQAEQGGGCGARWGCGNLNFPGLPGHKGGCCSSVVVFLPLVRPQPMRRRVPA